MDISILLLEELINFSIWGRVTCKHVGHRHFNLSPWPYIFHLAFAGSGISASYDCGFQLNTIEKKPLRQPTALACGVASTAQDAEYGETTGRALVLKFVVLKPLFDVCLRLERVSKQPPIHRQGTSSIVSQRARKGLILYAHVGNIFLTAYPLIYPQKNRL